MKLDFFARRAHYIDHMAPVWNILPAARRGVFHIARELEPYARQELREPQLEFFEGGPLAGDSPILVSSYGDLNKVIRNQKRKIITMEHGVTQGFQTAAYPNGMNGNRDRAAFALLPNEYVARRFRAVRETPCEVIGTPKMDEWVNLNWTHNWPAGFNSFPHTWPPRKSTLAIAFHWGDRHASPPESGSAFEHYRRILPELGARYNLIGHAHPLASPEYRETYERAGIEWVGDFQEVLRRADVYINDLSSTMYEFLVTGKPVVILNAPWFRRDVQWGIRFWDYSDVGLMVENPGELFNVIDRTLQEYGTICATARRRAVTDLYPYAGHSAYRAVEVVTTYLEDLEKARHDVLISK
jgi:hypothetical protein